MKHKLLIIAGILVVVGMAVAGGLYAAYPVRFLIFGALMRNYFLTWSAPEARTTLEVNPAYKAPQTVVASPPAASPLLAGAAGADWPSYNRTLTSERFSPLGQINTKNVGQLKVLCTYDIGQFTAFESGLIMVNNALIGATEFDIFSLNPATCAENWRTHEDYPANLIPVNRGVAYMDGLLFRGTQDGRVLGHTTLHLKAH
jgi:alcohol dehydrogenase (cytochrome c)